MPAELHSSDSRFKFTPAQHWGSNKIWIVVSALCADLFEPQARRYSKFRKPPQILEGRRVGDPDYGYGALFSPSPPSPTGERAGVRWRELAGDSVGCQPVEILFVPRAQRQDEKLRCVVGVLGENQFFQRGEF